MKKRISLILIACLLLCGCAKMQVPPAKAARSFTDSCGRTVELPEKVETVVPSGALAQLVLYTLCPEKLQSLSGAFSDGQKQYIPAQYWELPVTGQLFGGTVNYEEMIASCPDVIIDVGEPKNSIAEELDALQEATGIPCVFVQASLQTLPQTYEMLGELTDCTAQAEQCAAYIRSALDDAAKAREAVGDENRVRVLYAQGENGTEVLADGSIHAELLDVVGAENVAVLDEVSSKGGNEVSLEQIYNWDPEVLIVSENAEAILQDPAWQSVNAVRNGRVYEIPQQPYNWLDRPPSVQRILGLKWLGNLLYPELYDYDMVQETVEFYRLFFHCAISPEQARLLLHK